MINQTDFSYFYLTAYFDSGLLKYLYFLILLSLYLLIIATNVFLIVLICVNRSLHEPMYLFLCSLFVNELSGTLLCSHLCSCSVSSLAVMSYDRYLAICCPLHYNAQMTPQKVLLLILLSWLFSSIATILLVSLSAPLRLCGNIIHKVYCINYSIVKLACSDIRVNNMYALVYTGMTTVAPVMLVVYTYMRILKVCFSGSKQTRHKAVSTCTPHLASILNYTFGVFFEIIQSRLNMDNVPNVLQIILSFYLIICQPFFNPLAYGLKLSKIQNYIKNNLGVKWK
uniref:G-protein coupled receptors family 1 profile domain-containing protein n=1 Tax=Sphaeramia orbicularis TaxID=375764 RepID=A0A672ZML4_9TELE